MDWGNLGKDILSYGSGYGELKDILGSRLDNQYQNVNRADYYIPGYDYRNQALMNYANGINGRAAPQAQGGYLGQTNLGGYGGQFQAGQQALVQQLRRRAAGQDSLAALQLKQALGQNLAQQQALAASARPGNSAMAQRVAMQNAGMQTAGLSGQAQQAMLAEQLGAQNMLGGVLQGARGQDIGASQFNAAQQNAMAAQRAQLAQQLNQYNAGMQLQNRNANDQAFLNAMAANQAAANAQQQGNMGYQQNILQRFGIAANVPTPGEQALGALSTLGAAYATGGASLAARGQGGGTPSPYTPGPLGPYDPSDPINQMPQDFSGGV